MMSALDDLHPFSCHALYPPLHLVPEECATPYVVAYPLPLHDSGCVVVPGARANASYFMCTLGGSTLGRC